MQTRGQTWAAGFVAAVLASLFAACGTSSSDPASGGKAGSSTAEAGSGTGATSSGGSSTGAGKGPIAQAGEGPNEPVGGASPGAAGSGGSSNGGEPSGAGGGGNVNGGAECQSSDDCAVFNDCCECAVGAAKEPHPQCEKLCIQSACDARGITAQAECRSNRCVFDLSCNGALVTCDEAEPQCPAGQVASIDGNCWGPCIEATACNDVADCSACPAGTVCVTNQDSLGFIQCVEVAPSCGENPTCECTDACNFSCSDENGIACYCDVC